MGLFNMIGGSGREPYIKGAVRCPRCGLNLHPSIESCPACHQNMRVPAGQSYQPGAAPVQYPAQQFGVSAAGFMSDPSQVPPAPSEEMQPRQPSPGMQAPGFQMPPGPVVGVIQHDIVIGSALAFRAGERVQIEAESPDPERPEYKFVVFSPELNKRYRLSDLDVFF